MKPLSPSLQEIPLDIVGATNFGRYPKISSEQTFNMIMSDKFLVPYAGYKQRAIISNGQEGRGIYTSVKFNHMFFVVGNSVYKCNSNISPVKIGSISTFSGDISISENNATQIAISDLQHIYVYNYSTDVFSVATINFLPGFLTFQGTYFISVDLKNAKWRLSDFNNGLSWPDDSNHTALFETKADLPICPVPIPSKGNFLAVFGSIVTEIWNNTGVQLFPYQLDPTFNIDYGALNAATIAQGDKFIVWLAANEKSGPVIMFSEGGDAVPISNDGINFKLAQLKNPSFSYGFLFKQDGHLIYQLTFPDPLDNISYIYDFKTKEFFSVTDENLNYHIAKRVVAFNNSYYFVSFRDGNLYEMNSKYTDYNGAQIPRIRICKTIRMPDSSRFVVNNLTFPIEQGEINSLQSVDFCMSKNGSQTFSNFSRVDLLANNQRQNRINFWGKGIANEFTPQFRFWGNGRFVATNGVTRIFQ
jgi:hypothetical protein